MGAIVLPSDYGHLGESLGSLTTSIAKAVNPLHDLQVHLRDKAANDPEFAQHLADLESSSPGTLEALGFDKNMAKSIGKIQPSLARQVENKVAPLLNGELSPLEASTMRSQALTGKMPGQLEADKLAGEKAKATEDILNPDSPSYNKDIADETRFQMATGMHKFEMNQALLQAHASKIAMNTPLEGRNMGEDVKAMADSLEGGKGVDNNVLLAYNQTPGMGQAFHEMLNLEMQKRSFSNQMKHWGMLYDKQSADADNKDANRMVISSHGAYDKPTALAILHGNADTIRRMGELGSGTGAPMKPGEENLYRAAQYDKTGQETNFASARKDLITEFNATMGDMAKRQGPAKGVAAMALDNTLQRMAALNGDSNPIHISYDAKNDKIKYTQGGKELRQDTWMERLSNMFGGHSATNVNMANVNKTWTLLQGANVDKKGTLAKVKETSPEVYDELIRQHPELGTE